MQVALEVGMLLCGLCPVALQVGLNATQHCHDSQWFRYAAVSETCTSLSLMSFPQVALRKVNCK